MEEEINVKEIHWAADSAEFVTKRLKLNFPKAGPRLGKLLPKARAAVEAIADVSAVVAELDARGRAALEIDGAAVEVLADEIEVVVIEQEGSVCQSSDALLVVLDTTLTPALVAEGRARELVNPIQAPRKELNLNYEARIRVTIVLPAELHTDIDANIDYIKGEVLATEWTYAVDMAGDTSLPDSGVVETDVEGRAVRFKLVVAS